jgi:pimeloyl-ACP methyl ester carboxylesterase
MRGLTLYSRVIVPTHPGFGGTGRPAALTTIRDPAALYVALIGQPGAGDMTVIGNSIGGWITAEMALLAPPRIGRAVLVDAAGIEVPGHPIAGFFSLTMDQVFTLSFHHPGPFRIDPATPPPAAQAIAAGNRAALATYAGTAMSDPTLAGRLAHLEPATLVLWETATGSPAPATAAPTPAPSRTPASSRLVASTSPHRGTRPQPRCGRLTAKPDPARPGSVMAWCLACCQRGCSQRRRWWRPPGG